MKSLPIYPFDQQRNIGTVSEVGPNYAKTNLPRAALVDGQWLHGHHMDVGQVGTFVVIECLDLGVLGRITDVKLPERDRLSVEPGNAERNNPHPIGTIQLLSSFSVATGKLLGGLLKYPRLGSRVYAAHPRILKWFSESLKGDPKDGCQKSIELAYLPHADNVAISLTPERLFGRHCAVLGATGGGKSWTLARLIEQAAEKRAKIVLLDATGEFCSLEDVCEHVYLGNAPTDGFKDYEVVLPYTDLTESDLFALFKPSGQSQAPRLRAAMKSLKLARLEPSICNSDGVIEKLANRPRTPYDNAYRQHISSLEGPAADFDIQKLPKQIEIECVWPSGGSQQTPDYTVWGKPNDADRSYCTGIITRIEDILRSGSLACIFQIEGKNRLFKVVDEFLADSSKSVLRISLKYMAFEHNAREIVANAIGRYFLRLARSGRFKDNPLILFLDEAHQFLNKSLGDENAKYALDAFDLVAKEGRKYWLTLCMATQRPRDIPEGVLSQMGTMIVHRLTNDRDREVVERASGDIDRSAAEFLPALAAGQAVIIGVDFPIPLTVQIYPPQHKPESDSPNFQKFWGVTTGNHSEPAVSE